MAEWAIVALAIYRAGAAVVPLNTRFKGSEAAYILNASGARMLCTVTDFLDTDYVAMLRAFTAELPALRTIVTLRGTPAEGTLGWSEFRSSSGPSPSTPPCRQLGPRRSRPTT